MKAARTTITALAMIAVGVGVWGCSGEESPDADVTALTAPAATAGLTLAVPTVSDLASRIGNLTTSQRDALSSAIEALKTAVDECPVGEPGRSGRPGPRGFGAEEDMPDPHRPMHDFLEAAAEVLEPEQFADLARCLVEQREAHREEMAEKRESRRESREGRGFHGREHGPRGGGILDAMADDLDLSAEQREAIQAVMDEMHEALREHQEACRDGDEPREECRDEARELHEQYRARLEKILTPEQLEQMETLREERREERDERARARADARMQEMTGFLTRILDLDASQEMQVEQIASSARERAESLHEAVRGREVKPEEIRDQMEQIHDQAVESIGAILNEDQLVIFEALQNLMPGHGLGMGGGPGFHHHGGR